MRLKETKISLAVQFNVLNSWDFTRLEKHEPLTDYNRYNL